MRLLLRSMLLLFALSLLATVLSLLSERLRGAPDAMIGYVHVGCLDTPACMTDREVRYISANGKDHYAARINTAVSNPLADDARELEAAGSAPNLTPVDYRLQVQFIDWHPEGTHFVFTADGNRFLRRNTLFVSNINGTQIQRLRADPTCNDNNPRWSPDGEWIVFVRKCPPDISVLMLTRPDGSTLKSLITGTNVDDDIHWMPDSQSVLVTAQVSQGHFELLRVNISNSSRAVISTSTLQVSDPIAAPDGTQVAFTIWQDFEQWVSVVALDGTEELIVSGPSGFSVQHQWSPDGEWLYYLEQDRNNTLMRVRNNGLAGQALVEDVWMPQVSADGQTLLVLQQRADLTLVSNNGDTVTTLPTPDGNTQIAAWVPVIDRSWGPGLLSVFSLLAAGLAFGVRSGLKI